MENCLNNYINILEKLRKKEDIEKINSNENKIIVNNIHKEEKSFYTSNNIQEKDDNLIFKNANINNSDNEKNKEDGPKKSEKDNHDNNKNIDPNEGYLNSDPGNNEEIPINNLDNVKKNKNKKIDKNI